MPSPSEQHLRDDDRQVGVSVSMLAGDPRHRGAEEIGPLTTTVRCRCVSASKPPQIEPIAIEECDGQESGAGVERAEPGNTWKYRY